jgi:hypothetical protein
MRSVRRLTGIILKDRISNEDLRKKLGTEAAVDYKRRTTIKIL